MQPSAIEPVIEKERIHSIDIIRGFALLGILVINFTVDDWDAGIYDGFDGIGDQLAYWSIKILMDDRFQAIYCFLFGLGFAMQMQRAADRNSFFGFAHLRRMIALYLIAILAVILTGESNVLTHYAIVGVVLLLFWKVPLKFFPVLAIFFFALPYTRNTLLRIKSELKTQALSKLHIVIDSATADKYVGVYMAPSIPPPNNRLIIKRNKDSLIGVDQTREFFLAPLSDSHFIRRDFNQILTFKKDATGKENILTVRLPNGEISGHRIQIDFQQALKEQLQLRNKVNGPTAKKRLTYMQFVKKNALGYWLSLVYWNWDDFLRNVLWQNNYKVGHILVLFLLGVYAGKKRIFSDPLPNKVFLSKVFKWGLIAGGPGVLFSVGFQAWNFFNNTQWNSYSVWTRSFIGLPWDIGIIFVAMAYIAGMTLLVQNPIWQKRLSFFSTVGRLGLTNYILHLFALTIIFAKVSWFWGLEGKIGCVYRLLLAIPVYGILYLISRLWLKYFRQGPFEWLWRSLTYLKFQPMRINNSA